jgi:hypothetical protein
MLNEIQFMLAVHTLYKSFDFTEKQDVIYRIFTFSVMLFIEYLPSL